jgi:outer membrane receptor protein involved in Fe transport
MEEASAEEVPDEEDGLRFDRIEVIRGPGSALYGTDAFFAVINVISRDVGSLNTHHSRVTFGTKSKGGIDWLLSGTYYHSLGNKRVFYAEYNAPATNDGYAIDADGGRFGSVYGSMEYRGLRLAAAYVSATKICPRLHSVRCSRISRQGHVPIQFPGYVSWRRPRAENCYRRG